MRSTHEEYSVGACYRLLRRYHVWRLKADQGLLGPSWVRGSLSGLGL